MAVFKFNSVSGGQMDILFDYVQVILGFEKDNFLINYGNFE